MKCADLVWVATALLTREQPDRFAFFPDEIRRKMDQIEPEHGFSETTIRTHIRSHRVAKSGKALPKREQLPPAYRGLLNWYEERRRDSPERSDRDPLLALRGLGKDVWKALGGGEKFIREMRENWYTKRRTTGSGTTRGTKHRAT